MTKCKCKCECNCLKDIKKTLYKFFRSIILKLFAFSFIYSFIYVVACIGVRLYFHPNLPDENIIYSSFQQFTLVFVLITGVIYLLINSIHDGCFKR